MQEAVFYPGTQREIAATGEEMPTLESPRYAEKTILVRTAVSLRNQPARGLGLVIVLLMLLGSLLAPAISRHDPNVMVLEHRLQPPFWMEGGSLDHALGTDQVGRDLWARLVYGGRVSLVIACLAILVAAPTGILIGVSAGYWGGVVDTIAMRLTDAQLAFPPILLAVTLLAVIGRSTTTLILALGLTGWMVFAATVRAQVLSLRETESVAAARVLGANHLRILFLHILPNCLTPIVILASFTVAQMILAESSLSFLGLGVQSPTPSWGRMLSDGREYLANAWWLATWPGLAVLITVLAINAVGDWLLEILGPRSAR